MAVDRKWITRPDGSTVARVIRPKPVRAGDFEERRADVRSHAASAGRQRAAAYADGVVIDEDAIREAAKVREAQSEAAKKARVFSAELRAAKKKVNSGKWDFQVIGEAGAESYRLHRLNQYIPLSTEVAQATIRDLGLE